VRPVYIIIAGVRNMGFSAVPLLSAREVAVPGSLPRIVRVLMHYHAPGAHARATSTWARRARCARISKAGRTPVGEGDIRNCGDRAGDPRLLATGVSARKKLHALPLTHGTAVT